MRESDATFLTAATAQDMERIGHALAGALSDAHGKSMVIALAGELGAGKTTLVRGVLSGLGVTGPVRSPTYTLIEPYEVAARSVYHLDLYRLAHPAELENLGLRDLLDAEAILLVEWAERGVGVLPSADLLIDISYPPNAAEAMGRIVQFSPRSAAGEQLNFRFRSVKLKQSDLSP